jgi:outer membrane receptor for ferrienterochelin and colicin
MNHPVRLLRALAACATLCASVLCVQQSRADDLADEADLQFTLGAEKYQAGDYRSALEHFLVSNRLVPNRNVVYNIARAYEQLKQYPEAFRYYTQALDQETDQAARARIETAIGRISSFVSVLDITTDPPGATIFIDRKDLGPRGSAPRKLALPAGKYKVMVAMPGYEPAETDGVEARPGTPRPVRLSLKRILGTLQVQGEPAGAEIRVDNETGPVACKIPCKTDLPPGRHAIYVTKERYQSTVQEVDIQPRAAALLRPKLNPLRGNLVVNTDERDAMVEVDGRSVGFTPSVVSVQAGQRTLRITLPGFRPIERVVSITPNQETRLDLEMRQLDEVSAASRTTESVEDAPSSVSIIGQQELRAMAYPTIAEALRGVRGVFLNDDGAYASVGFRGFARSGDYGNRVLVLQDGMPTNDNWIGSSYVGYDARTDLEDIERIEVVRGPGSVLYGTGAFSGVINLVTRYKDMPTGGEVGVGTSAYGGARARGRVNLKFGPDAGLWMSVSGMKAHGRDYYFPEFADEGGWARGVDGFKAGTLQGRVWWKSLTMQWFLHSHDKQLPTGAYDTLFADPRTRLADTRGFVEGRFEPKLSDKVQLLARAYANLYQFRGTYAYTFAPPDEDGVQRERYRGAWAGGEGRVVVTPLKALRITAGGDGQHHFQVNQEGHNDTRTYLDENRPYQVAAGYLLADVTPHEAIRLSGGARLDWYSTFGSSINPRAAVIIHPYERGTIKLLAGKAFRAPSIYELYYNDGGRTEVASVDKTKLRPETIYSPELELTHRFSTTWVGQVAGYGNYIRDLIVSRGEGVPASPYYYENSNSPVLTMGGEAEVRREWRQGWMLGVSYAYQHSKYTETREPDGTGLRHVPNSPEHLATFKAAVPVIPRVLTVATRLTIEGPRYDNYDHDTDPAQQGKTEPAVLWDVVLSGDAARGVLHYAVGVYNAFDWRYQLPISTDYRQRTMLQSGRTFVGTLAAHF